MKLVLSKESPETKTRNEIQGGKIQTAEKYPIVWAGGARTGRQKVQATQQKFSYEQLYNLSK